MTVLKLRSAVQNGERLRVHVWNQSKTHRGFWSLLSLHPAVGEETITAASAPEDSFKRIKGTSFRSPRPSKESPELPPGVATPRSSSSTNARVQRGSKEEVVSHTDTDLQFTSSFPVRMRTRYMMGVQLRLSAEEMRLLAEVCAWASEENGADSTFPGSFESPRSPSTSPELRPLVRRQHRRPQAAASTVVSPERHAERMSH